LRRRFVFYAAADFALPSACEFYVFYIETFIVLKDNLAENNHLLPSTASLPHCAKTRLPLEIKVSFFFSGHNLLYSADFFTDIQIPVSKNSTRNGGEGKT
jgi:hypothetical protein